MADQTEATMAEPFVSPCLPPEGHPREVATILMEECAEVQQRASKLLRFGIEEVQPGQPHSNADRLGHEIGDLLEVVALAVRAGLTTNEAIGVGRENKQKQLRRFMQTKGITP